MLKVKLITILVGILTIIGNSNAIGHGGDPADNNHMGDGTHYVDNNHVEHHKNGHMSDHSEYVDINASIGVDEAIHLSILIAPNSEMERIMIESDHIEQKSLDYMNSISINILSIVEFSDLTNNGFTSDDEVISTFYLNSSTLNSPVQSDNSTYFITSKQDDTFVMVIDINTENEVFNSFKWSIELQYPSNNSSSTLAMLHSIETENGSMMERNGWLGSEKEMSMDNFKQENNYHMNDLDHTMPMFFQWARTAFVDNSERSVIASLNDNIFALAIPKGSLISYDPSIGIEPSSIVSISEIFDTNLNFYDTLKSPNIAGLLGSALILTMIIISVRFKYRRL